MKLKKIFDNLAYGEVRPLAVISALLILLGIVAFVTLLGFLITTTLIYYGAILIGHPVAFKVVFGYVLLIHSLFLLGELYVKISNRG